MTTTNTLYKNLFKIYTKEGSTILARFKTLAEVKKYLESQSPNTTFLIEDVVNDKEVYSDQLFCHWNQGEEIEDLKLF